MIFLYFSFGEEIEGERVPGRDPPVRLAAGHQRPLGDHEQRCDRLLVRLDLLLRHVAPVLVRDGPNRDLPLRVPREDVAVLVELEARDRRASGTVHVSLKSQKSIYATTGDFS